MFRNTGGYACIEEPDKPRREADTFSCGHCNSITHVKAKADPTELGGLCKVCMKLICCKCVGKGCDPLEEKLRRWESKQDSLRSYGL